MCVILTFSFLLCVSACVCVCVSCRDQLESEKKKRENIEREKQQMERDKQELMMKLYEFEETTKRAERGGAHHVTRKLSKYEPGSENVPKEKRQKKKNPVSLWTLTAKKNQSFCD